MRSAYHPPGFFDTICGLKQIASPTPPNSFMNGMYEATPQWGYTEHMKQQDILREAMRQSGQTRADLAAILGVSKRALDKWLLPETSGDFRQMPAPVARLLASEYGVRKSADLSLPYDWPDPAMADAALILAVLRRARFADLVRVCSDFGMPAVRAQLQRALEVTPTLERDLLARILDRMLRSIEIALAERAPT
jgi:transcriptional regulator with XRE-family HTH domain